VQKTQKHFSNGDIHLQQIQLPPRRPLFHTGNFGACSSAKVKTARLDNLGILKNTYKLHFKIFCLLVVDTLQSRIKLGSS